MEILRGVGIYIDDIKMEFAMLIMRNGERHMTEGIELPNQEKIRRYK